VIGDGDVLVATIDDLLANCRSALIALLPAAERAMLTWADDNQHRDWERLAECVFDALVRGPVISDRNRLEDEFVLARYEGRWWGDETAEVESRPQLHLRPPACDSESGGADGS
jgi:hypothetical protein